jgi:hypothetical protein
VTEVFRHGAKLPVIVSGINSTVNHLSKKKANKSEVFCTSSSGVECDSRSGWLEHQRNANACVQGT